MRGIHRLILGHIRFPKKVFTTSALLGIIIFAFQNCAKTFSASNTDLSSNGVSLSSLLDGHKTFSGEWTPALGGPEVLTISNPVFESTLQIQAHSNFAYAISSLTFRGKEFVNYTDHGRELQSASSFDGFGECFNPTEAGSRDDGGIESRGTSLALGYYASGDTMATRTDMAFWLHGSQPYLDQPSCGSHKELHQAFNSTDRGNHIFEKNVTIGYDGLENVIAYNVTYHVPEAHQSATFEALTGYMPPEFDHFLTYDPNSQSLIQILPAASPPADGEQALPLILSTGDRNFAMGVYSPELPQNIANAGYGHFSFPGNTNKWNCVFRETNLSANSTYKYRCFVIVGTVDEVRLGIDKLHAKFHPSNSTAMPNVSAPAQQTAPQAVPQSAPVAKPILKNIYRYYDPQTGDHFFTDSKTEGSASRYSDEGVGFKVVTGGDPAASIVLYRCLIKNTSRHFISGRSDCEGQSVEAALGNIYPIPTSESLPLYRLYNGIGHLSTANPAELKAPGYKLEGIYGYAPMP